ncbi:hypothetical protein ACFQQB_47410 [Nonomuraea rubra]|uniref:hypothetical protein n=1 Tax=Nonomuraea rubra TaxID=46180 RepID=UPI00360C9C54
MHLSEADAAAAAEELGLPAARLRLIWIVAVNTGLLQILGGRASRGPLSMQLTVEATLEFWDGVVMDVLDRADEGLTGSAVVDGHLAEMLATIYSVRSGVATANLARGILQSHEVACAPGPVEMRKIAAALPAELLEALSLLTYCGLVEQTAAGRTALTPLGVWAIRRDLLREGTTRRPPRRWRCSPTCRRPSWWRRWSRAAPRRARWPAGWSAARRSRPPAT